MLDTLRNDKLTPKENGKLMKSSNVQNLCLTRKMAVLDNGVI